MNDSNIDDIEIHNNIGDINIHAFAGIVMLAVSPFGVAANAYVFLNVLSRRQSRNSFLTLCASKALFNFVICFVFLIWCTPIAFLHAYFLPPVVGMIFGNVVGGMLYLGGVITQVLASVNRLIASFSIQLYSKFCTLRNTMIFLTLCWMGTFALAVIYSLGEIGYLFDAETLIWQGDGKPKSTEAFELIGLIVYLSTAVMFILNTVTFVKLIMLTKSNTVLSSTESTKRMKRNRVLFVQKVLQDCLYLVDMLFAQALSELLPYNWWQFLCSSFVWLTLNTLDGFIMIIFVKDLNDPIRKRIRQFTVSFFPHLQKSNDLFIRRQSNVVTKATISS
ncbi:unnamed protein product [Cylicocyclus nassatus]|uniref:7TM GPCR serpentine receptor class x (Srx) domain-containing protein n=1 Tax=Cylicocyclus nassatus TaxID=53992 RepID=A0AA36M7M4_CYLNA|nr:unnamed protein product [Cylicocyclus nassatus]